MQRNVLIECCLVLSLFRNKGASDARETARQNAQKLAHRALHAEAGAPAAVDPESPVSLLLRALDYCDAEGVPHSELVEAFNSHAERALPARRSPQQELHS